MLPFDMMLSAAGAAGNGEGAKLFSKDGAAKGGASTPFASLLKTANASEGNVDGDFSELPTELFGVLPYVPTELASVPAEFALQLEGMVEGGEGDAAPLLPDDGELGVFIPEGGEGGEFADALGKRLQASASEGQVATAAPVGAPRLEDTSAPIFDSMKAQVGVVNASASDAVVASAAVANGDVQAALVQAPLMQGLGKAVQAKAVETNPAQTATIAQPDSDGLLKDVATSAPKVSPALANIMGAADGDVQAEPAKKWQAGLPQELRASVSNSAVVPNAQLGAAKTEVPVTEPKSTVAVAARTVPILPEQASEVAKSILNTEVQVDTADVLDRAAVTGDGEGSLVRVGEKSVQAVQSGQVAQVPLSKDVQTTGKVEQAALPVDDFSATGIEEGAVDPGEPQNEMLADKKPVVTSPAGTARDVAAQNQANLKQETLQASVTVSAADVESDFEPELDTETALRLTGAAGDAVTISRSDPSVRPGQVHSSQIAMQVAGEMARNLHNGQTRFQMRFDPPELGRVDVKMKVSSDGSVQAHLIVERPETLDLFMRDQRGLERALGNAGLTVDTDNMKFSLQDQGSSGFQFSEGRDQSGEGRDYRNASNGDGFFADDDEIGPASVRLDLTAKAGGLDVRI